MWGEPELGSGKSVYLLFVFIHFVYANIYICVYVLSLF